MAKPLYASAAGKRMYHHTQAEETGLGEAAAEKAYAQQNCLLAALPAAEREQLLPALKQMYLPGCIPDRRRANSQAPQDCVPELFHPAILRRQASLPLAGANARAALLASENRFRVLFEQVSDGIFIGVAADGRFAEVNTAFCSILGHSREELYGARILRRVALTLAKDVVHRRDWDVRTHLPREDFTNPVGIEGRRA